MHEHTHTPARILTIYNLNYSQHILVTGTWGRQHIVENTTGLLFWKTERFEVRSQGVQRRFLSEMKCSHYYIYILTPYERDSNGWNMVYKKNLYIFTKSFWSWICFYVWLDAKLFFHTHRNCPTEKKDWRQDYRPPCSGSRPLWMNQRMTLRW